MIVYIIVGISVVIVGLIIAFILTRKPNSSANSNITYKYSASGNATNQQVCQALNGVTDTNQCLSKQIGSNNLTCFINKVMNCCVDPNDAINDPGYLDPQNNCEYGTDRSKANKQSISNNIISDCQQGGGKPEDCTLQKALDSMINGWTEDCNPNKLNIDCSSSCADNPIAKQCITQSKSNWVIKDCKNGKCYWNVPCTDEQKEIITDPVGYYNRTKIFPVFEATCTSDAGCAVRHQLECLYDDTIHASPNGCQLWTPPGSPNPGGICRYKLS